MLQPQEGDALRPEDCHASGAMTNNGDCPPRRMGSVKRAPPDQLRGCAETRRFVGSDVVSVSQNSRLDATDHVGQASRRYRIWRGGFSPFRLILMKL